MIVQCALDEISNNTKLWVHSNNQISIFQNQLLNWEFLEGVKNSTSYGNKAHRLAVLSQKEFNIPKTIVLPHSTIETIYKLASSAPGLPNEYKEELTQLLNALTQQASSLIVRSSTNIEDSSEQTFAGIFHSEANVKTVEQLIAALCNVWQQFLSQKEVLKNYNEKRPLTMSLIIQPYIEGDFGGVLFTTSNKPDHMYVEMAQGGAEGVTSGHAILSSLYINETGAPTYTFGEKDKLSISEYQILYHLGQKIEALFGKPQDIEWIISERNVYVIQSRDIIEDRA